MRKAALAVLLLLIPASSLFAQNWRYGRPYQPVDNRLDLTPFVGYRWGGTISADQTNLYGHDVDLQSSANYGVSFGIPVAPNGIKLELMVDRQNTTVGTGHELFAPAGNVGNFDVTYYHAGLMVPFAPSRTATPYFVVSAGLANLDPNEQGASSANKFSVAAGVGVNVPINPNLGIRAEFRGFYTPMGNNNSTCSYCYYDYYRNDLTQGEAKVGVSFKF